MTPLKPDTSMASKVCIITGANAGIGRHTAIGLARRGARVVMVCRNPTKAEPAHAEVSAVATAAGAPAVELVIGDLGSIATTNALADQLLERFPKVDVLINNAGVWITQRRENADGYEATFGTNHLAPFLLTSRLLGAVEATEHGRIITLSSALHRRGVVDFDDLHRTRRSYSGVGAYGDSKLMNIMFTRSLARRLTTKGSLTTVNAVHPGRVHTDITKKAEGFIGLVAKLLTPVVSPFLLSAEQGAATSIHVATSEEGGRVTGRYFAKSAVAQPKARAEDDETAEKLWDVSCSLVGLRDFF